MLRDKPLPLTAAAFLIPLVLQATQPGQPVSNRATATPRNIQVSHERFPAYGEPYLAVNPRNRRNLLGAAQDIGRCPVPGTFASFDGGRTWRDNGALPLPAGARCGGDVSVAFDAGGTGFVASHAGPSMFVDTVLVWRTDDGGQHFARPVVVYDDRHQQVDQAWLAVDATRGRHGGSLYLAWTASDPNDYPSGNRLLFSRSTDGGRHFSPPRTLVAVLGHFPAIPVLAVGRDGKVQVFFALGRQGGLFPPVGLILREVVTSSDGGRSFGPLRPIAAEPVFLQLTGRNEFNIQAAAADPTRGTLYLAMAAPRPGTRRADILFWRSPDGGQSWLGPARVNDDGHADADCFQPQIAVSASGNVYVSYFRLARGRVDLFLAHSRSQGASFSPPMRISGVSFDPNLSSEHRENGVWIGDYEGLAAAPGVIYPFWNDTRTGHLAIFAAAVPAS
jgi:hypothetical protein